MRHVFLETNWLVAIAAPAQRSPASVGLLESAIRGDIRIYIPACCIGEAKKTIRSKFQPKEADRLRAYVRWALEENLIDNETAESARRMLQSFQDRVTSDLAHLNDTLRNIAGSKGVEVVPLGDAVLNMSLELHFTEITLSEFDRAVLAAVLINGRSLSESGETNVNFCGIDSNLWPWEKRSPQPRRELKKLYDDAGVWVYSDFTLTTPERPHGFPNAN